MIYTQKFFETWVWRNLKFYGFVLITPVFNALYPLTFILEHPPGKEIDNLKSHL